MKILIISEMSTPHATGGGEVRYALLARQLAAAGHDVTWLSMKQRGAGADERIDGVRHRHRGPRISRPPERSLWAKLAFMATVLLYLLRHRHDVVDCQTYAPLPAAWLGCRLTRQVLVATIHDTAAAVGGGSSDQWLSSVDQWLAAGVERRLYRLRYDHILTVGDAVRADLAGRWGVRVPMTVVPNAVEIARIDSVSADAQACDLIFVARLVPHKHPEVFLRLAAALQRERVAAGRTPLRLKLVGEGPLADTVAALAADLGLGPSIIRMGLAESHTEVLAHIKSARVLVLPSTREGFGLVLAEAMACRVAVAAYGVPAVRETLGPALQEALVEPEDEAGLTALVGGLLDSPERLARQIALGRARVEACFDAPRFGAAVTAVYRTAIEARRG